MGLVILVVFLGVFAVAALISAAAQAPAASTQRIRANLVSALKLGRLFEQDEVVDVAKDTKMSSVPWLDRALANLDSAVSLRLTLEQADLDWSPARLILGSVLLWAIAAIIINYQWHPGALCLAMALPAGLAPFLYVWRARSKRFEAFEAALPQALDLMVSGLRAGHSLVGTLKIVATEAPEPVRGEFNLCFEEQNYGLELRTAFDNLIRRVPLPEVRIILAAILIQKESGGNLAELLERTAHVIRERFHLRQQIMVHTAQSRSTGWILTAMPIALGILLSFVKPAYMRLLLETSMGRKMILIGGSMNLFGLFIIRKIVRIRV